MSLEEGDFGGLGTDDEDVGESSGELQAIFVLDIDNFVGARVLFDSEDGADSADVISAGDHDLGAQLVLEVGDDFVGAEVELDGVLGIDLGVGEADGPAVVGDDIGDTLGAHGSSLHSAQFELSLAGGDLGQAEATFAVVEESVAGLGLQEGDHIHEAYGEFVVLSHFAVDGDVAFLGQDDHLGFPAGEGEFQLVSQEDVEGDGLSQLVGTLRGFGCPNAADFAQQPVLGSADSLQMLSGTSFSLFLKRKFTI